MTGRWLIVWLAIVYARAAYGDVFDELDQKLTFSTADGRIVTDLSVMADAALFVQNAPAQGLLFTDNDALVAPRLALFLDSGIGERVLVHVQLDGDTGSDPNQDKWDLRFDEYYVEALLTEPDQGRVALRVGKFATVFGSWISRHLAWDDPMITPPLIYADMLPITDQTVPANAPAFALRRNVVDKQFDWLPIVWGAGYTTGASLSAGTATFDSTVEVKNGSISSRPATWDIVSSGRNTDPNVTARVRWHPVEEWWLGSSVSRGPYLQSSAEPVLAQGESIDDFDQTTWGVDANYEHRRLQVWSEFVLSTFDVPGIGDVNAYSGFVEARFKVVPQVWLGARWNQSWFDDVNGATWNRDMRRLDVAAGYRFTAHLEAKAQFSWSDAAGRTINGEHLYAAQLVVWF